MRLTEEQQQIVHHRSGHALVSAVAGSGKTTTMVARVAHLLRQGSAPGEMLVLMLNRSARDSFAEALRQLLSGERLTGPEVRTFHALGLRLVESFTRRGALPRRSLVTDEHIREKLAKQALNAAYKEENGDHAWVTKEDLEEFLRFIDLVKAGIVSADLCFAQENLPEECAYFITGYQRFEAARVAQRIRFYEDLLHEPLLAMLGDQELASWVSNRLLHIIVDEYQDINEVQQQLLKILAGQRAAVMVVGDVDQCIYEWRGARPEYITDRFPHDFPNPARYTLSSTFRYGHRLSLAANHLIAGNRKRDRKLCLSAAENFDTRISRHEERNPHPILDILAEWRQQGRALSEAAVLVRLFAMSVPLELALLEAGIPYRLEGHEQVFGCREILALTGYLKYCCGTLQEEAMPGRADYLLAMLSQPHIGVRQEELEKLAARIAAEVTAAPQRILDHIHGDMPVFAQKRLVQAAEDWQWLQRRPGGSRADILLGEIISRLDLYDFYYKFSSRQVTAENRIETCRAFVDFAARHKLSADDFLARLESLKRPAESGTAPALLITSIHRAKGLEWPLVIIPGLRDGVFPMLTEAGEGADGNCEDERRLFYVALTRAIAQVALIHPADVQLKKHSELGLASPPPAGSQASRFLFESNLDLSDRLGALLSGGKRPEHSLVAAEPDIANAYLRRVHCAENLVVKRSATINEAKRGQRVLRNGDLAVGIKVWHSYFGDGVIVEVLARDQGRIRVVFAEHGEKTLLLSYAPLMLRK